MSTVRLLRPLLPAACAVALAALTACAQSGSSSTTSSTPAAVRRHHPRPHHRPIPPSPSAGSLPQTDVLPSAGTRGFQSEMADLWRGIQSDATRAALPAFFPVDAYVQLKALGDARGDWRNRLVADFSLDIAAAHRLLGAGAAADRLVTVLVPQGFAHWVGPGVCANSIGYYEVPNARVVYRGRGGPASFGIASMISWRGVWYVVHLGAVLRASAAGFVDDPSPGTGTSAYSSTC